MENALLFAIEAIYAAAPDPSLWPKALKAIADVFGDLGTVLMYRRDDGSFGTIVSHGLEEAQRAYEAEWWRDDLRAYRGIERGYTGSGEAVTDRHVASQEEIESHPIYQKFLVPHGLGWFAGIAVSPDPRVQAWISVQRSHTKCPYSDLELNTLNQIGRHAEQALRLSIRLLDAELANAALSDALARVGIGVIALDSLGRVVASNAAAERLTDTWLRIVDGRLRIAVGPDRGAAENAIARSLRAGFVEPDPRPILIRRPESGRALTMYLLPVKEGSGRPSTFLTHTRLIVLLIDPQSQEPADPALVRDLLGLTLGEARVAALVGAGLPPREAAQKLGIREETARTALKRVFSKTGVSRQSELTALLSRLVLR